MVEYHIAWWNLENLFDSVRSRRRPDWLQSRLENELAGWTSVVVGKKVAQLAEIINAMNDGRGPDLLGVCEVENGHVLRRLVKRLNRERDYAVVHHDMSDKRGIDVAFIYDAALLEAESQFHHVVLKRNATRDIFQVNFKTRSGRTLIGVGNHWPSRSGGEMASRPYRQMAGETLAYWMERIREIQGPDVPVIVMGDFNDEPFDTSLTTYALAERNSARVASSRSRKAYLLDLMWPLMGRGIGTHYYNRWGMLDQILVNRALLHESGHWQLVPDSIQIVRFPQLMKNGRPRRFGRPSGTGGSRYDEQGYSDHLPVECRVVER